MQTKSSVLPPSIVRSPTTVYAFQTEDGTLLWKAPLDSATTLPLNIVDGLIYLCIHSSCSALRASDGSSLWQQQLGSDTGAANATSPVAANKVIYAGTDDGYVYALRANEGSLLWKTFISTSVTVAFSSINVEKRK